MTYNVVFIEEVTAVLTTVVGEAVAVVETHDENLCRRLVFILCGTECQEKIASRYKSYGFVGFV
jgi:hypothetical protein